MKNRCDVDSGKYLHTNSTPSTVNESPGRMLSMNSRPSRPYSTSRFLGSCRVTAIFWLVPGKSCEGARVEYVMVPVPEELADRVLKFVEYKRQYDTVKARQAE